MYIIYDKSFSLLFLLSNTSSCRCEYCIHNVSSQMVGLVAILVCPKQSLISQSMGKILPCWLEAWSCISMNSVLWYAIYQPIRLLLQYWTSACMTLLSTSLWNVGLTLQFPLVVITNPLPIAGLHISNWGTATFYWKRDSNFTLLVSLSTVWK